MAQVTRRYVFQGPPTAELQDTLDPGLTIKLGFTATVDVTFDDAVCSDSAVDAEMLKYGWTLDGAKTAAVFALTSVDKTDWALEVDDLGVLTAKKT